MGCYLNYIVTVVYDKERKMESLPTNDAFRNASLVGKNRKGEYIFFH